jgi:hypothetical protein
MNKKIISYAILPVLGLALLSAGVTYAASNNTGAKPMDALVSALATKFNLNSSDIQQVVEQVMSEQRTIREAEMTKNFTTRLNQAVTDKKLTQSQADLIIAKQAELKNLHLSLEDKTEAERQAIMKKEMSSLQKWATDNNIPKEYLMFGKDKGPGPRGHRGDHEKFNEKKFNAATTTK